MLVGHFAVGFVAKRAAPQVSLGTLVMAAMLADLLWAVFMIAGIEHVQFTSGRGAANYIASFDAAFSHSLLMDVVWGALFAAVYYWKRQNRQGGWILFAAVVSHWPLDVISSRPLMPLAPGLPIRMGLGLWTSILATIIVEGGFWVLGLILYLRATSSKNRASVFLFWIVAGFLTLAWYNNIAGPPPPDPRTAPIASLVFFSLLVGWGYWMNRLRPART